MRNLTDDPIESALVFTQAFLANQDIQSKHMQIVGQLRQKYSFFAPAPGSAAGATVPFDYLADFLRGFTGIIQDVKKCPDKIVEACEAVLPDCCT